MIVVVFRSSIIVLFNRLTVALPAKMFRKLFSCHSMYYINFTINIPIKSIFMVRSYLHRLGLKAELAHLDKPR